MFDTLFIKIYIKKMVLYLLGFEVTSHFKGDFLQVRDFWIDGKFYVFDTLFIKIYIKKMVLYLPGFECHTFKCGKAFLLFAFNN